MTLKKWLILVLEVSLAGLLVLLGLCFLVSETHCQTPELEFRQRLADASFVIRIDGVEHRCLGPDKVREILLDQAELKASRELVTNLQDQITLLTAERDALRRADKLADEQLANLNERLTGLEVLLKRQTDLFNQYIAANKRSKLAAWLDSPVTSLALKLGMPGLNLLMTGLRLK